MSEAFRVNGQRLWDNFIKCVAAPCNAVGDEVCLVPDTICGIYFKFDSSQTYTINMMMMMMMMMMTMMMLSTSTVSTGRLKWCPAVKSSTPAISEGSRPFDAHRLKASAHCDY